MTSCSRSLRRSFGPAAVAVLLTGLTLRAQGVTDPAIVTPYGAACGVGLTAADSIQGDGSHQLAFAVATTPFAPAVLAVGFDATLVPLPPTGCHLLTDPIGYLLAATDGTGHADFLLPLPSSWLESLRVQAGTFDAALAIQTSQGLQLDFPGVSPTPDPSVHTEYACVYSQYWNWNYGGDGVPTVHGKVWWPSGTCQSVDGPPDGLPTIVFLHGNGMTNEDHDYLLTHLARNGFVACSIENGGFDGGSNEGRAREAISYLNGMHAFWGHADRLTNDVVFMGHSRGGEAAVTAARLLAQNPSWAHVPYDVEAVVSIAPTDGGGDNSDTKENLDGTMTRAFLAIYGSRDPDVRGIRLEDPLTGPENTAFAIYDRAGTESSIEGVLSPAANLKKAMVFVHGATHRGFLDGCNILDGGTIGCSSHKDVARGFVTAFLRWQVDNESAYREYFDGSALPTSVRVAEVDVFEQFADHPRRVLDNFEQPGWNTNTRAGSVVAGTGIAQIAEDDLWQLDPSVPHDTRGLRVKWGGAGGKYVGWNVPIANVPFAGPARDVTDYDVLSFRIAQDYLDAWNTPGQDRDLRVRLYTGNGWSSFVQVSDHGRIPSPDVFFAAPYPYPSGDFTKSTMTTIRLPLDAFAGADLNDVQWVYLYFDVPGHTQGSVVLDSLEFSR